MNLKKIQAVVMAFPNPPCLLLTKWLSGRENFGMEWRTSPPCHGIELGRNKEITRFLREDVPRGKTHLLMLDHDTVPLLTPFDLDQGETGQILFQEGDLLWCGMVGRQGSKGHTWEGDFGPACCRISAALLQKMPQPWFKPTYNAEWTMRTACGCVWFHACAVKADAVPKRVGIAGHQQGGNGGCILIPSPKQKQGWQSCWPLDLLK